jgi:hypothetical protein
MTESADIALANDRRQLQKILIDATLPWKEGEKIGSNGPDFEPDKFGVLVQKYRELDVDCAEFSNFGPVIQKIAALFWKHPLKPIGNIITTLRAGVNCDDGECSEMTIYGYVYWEGTRPVYFTYGPTYISQDGEYTDAIASVQAFEDIRSEFDELAKPYEAGIIKMLSLNELVFVSKSYPEDRAEEVNAGRWDIIVFIVCLFLGATFQPHVLASHKKVIDFVMARVETPIKIRKNEVEWISRLGVHYRITCCGQKLVPLTITETAHVMDVNEWMWREIWVYQVCTDAVINLLTDLLPITTAWTVLEGIDHSLFHGAAMPGKYRRSKQAQKIIAELNRIDQDMETGADFKAGPSRQKLRQLVSSIEARHILSPYALSYWIENAGTTTFSMPTQLGPESDDASPKENVSLDSIRTCLFTGCFSLYVLHVRLNILQGDLHYNNSVTHKSITTEAASYKKPDNHFVHVYCTKNATFVIPIPIWRMLIIDFSRAILGSWSLQKLSDDIDVGYSNFVKQQQRTIFEHAFNRIAPTNATTLGATEASKFAELFYGHFDQLFWFISFSDLLSFFHGTVAAWAQSQWSDEAKKFLRNMFAQCQIDRDKALVTLLQHPDQIDLTHFPIETLMIKMFPEFLLAAQTNIEAVEPVGFYIPHQPMKYSMWDPDKLPPWANKSEMQKIVSERMLNALFPSNHSEMLASIAARNKVKLQIHDKTKDETDQMPMFSPDR